LKGGENLNIYNWVIQRKFELKNQQEKIKEELEFLEKLKEYILNNFSDEAAQATFERYMLHIEAYCNWLKVVENGAEIDPDENFMRSIETTIGISENAKKAFREEVLIRSSAHKRKGVLFNYQTHERLKEAIIKSL
jgi:serine protein kinase